MDSIIWTLFGTAIIGYKMDIQWTPLSGLILEQPLLDIHWISIWCTHMYIANHGRKLDVHWTYILWISTG